MKKTVWIFLVCAALLLTLVFVGSGFNPRTDVFLQDYSVSADGRQITMEVGIATSMGYTRGYHARLGGFNQYITFYTPYGGFNSSLGAKTTFQLEVDPVNCEEIYFFHGDGGYTLVLCKDAATGQWKRPE